MSDRLQAGEVAPDFTLTNDAGESVTLSDLRGQQVTVLGISPDAPAKLARFRDKENLRISLLSDPDRSVMTRWGAFGEKMMYGKKVTGVIRSTIVVGADGTITHAWYNVKATGHVASLRKKLGLDG